MTAPPVTLRDRVVGMGEFVASKDPAERLVAPALGSAVAVTVHDPVARVGGILHAILPTSALDPHDARHHPGRFVDTGIPALFHALYALGAVRRRLVVKLAGGSADDDDRRDGAGTRNVAACHRLLQRNGVNVHAQDHGGVRCTRHVALRVATGDVSVETDGRLRTL